MLKGPEGVAGLGIVVALVDLRAGFFGADLGGLAEEDTVSMNVSSLVDSSGFFLTLRTRLVCKNF